jgi:hypothetical protein
MSAFALIAIEVIEDVHNFFKEGNTLALLLQLVDELEDFLVVSKIFIVSL